MQQSDYKGASLALVSVLAALASPVHAEFELDRSVMADRYWEVWNEAEQARIDADIEANRKADGEFVVDAPVGAEVDVEQLDHEFRFGAHLFNFNQLGRPDWNDIHKASFGRGGIFNQATVAFYWKDYEPVPGRMRAGGGYEDSEGYWNALPLEEAQRKPFWRRPAPGPVIDFLKARDVRIHGHILVWGFAKPDWIYDWFCPEEEKCAFDRQGIPRHSSCGPGVRAGGDGADYNAIWKSAWREAYGSVSEEAVAGMAPVFTRRMRELFRKRVRDVAATFGEVVDSWDVVNESSKDWARYRKSRTGLPVWLSEYGLMPGDYPLHALLDANAAFPGRAKLAINDYNVGDDFLSQVRDLESEGARIDLVGCQMHLMDTNDCARLARGEPVGWVGSPGAIRDRLDVMARTGRPLHVSEVTIGAPGGDDRSRMIQAVLTRNIYRAWFAHPKTMGITWWNTVDGGGLCGEPLVSGVFTRDMVRKPAYLALDGLINREWRTRLVEKVTATDGDGRGVVRFRGFRGKYRLSWQDADGRIRFKDVVLTGVKSSDRKSPVPATSEAQVRPYPVCASTRIVRSVKVYGPFPKDDPILATEKSIAVRHGAGRTLVCGADGYFDLNDRKVTLPRGTCPDYAMYAVIRVKSPRRQCVRFAQRNDWFGSVFVNGIRVGGDLEGVVEKWSAVRIRLLKGWNEIVFRTSPGFLGRWISSFAFDDVEGSLEFENTQFFEK